MAVSREGTKKLPKRLGTRARAWPEGRMLAGPAEARKKGGRWRQERNERGEGGPWGRGDPLAFLAPLSPCPHFSPSQLCHPQPTPVPQVSGGLALRWVDPLAVRGMAAMSGPGDSSGAGRTLTSLVTWPPSATHSSGPAS